MDAWAYLYVRLDRLYTLISKFAVAAKKKVL